MSDFHATPLVALANEGSKEYGKSHTIEFNLIISFYRATELELVLLQL